jgi:hypothetical protein
MSVPHRKRCAMPIIQMLLWVLIVVSTWPTPARGSTAAHPAPAVEAGTRRDLDIRDDSAQRAPRYVVFCSRSVTTVPPSPGHAFVVWGYDDPERGLCAQTGWGYYSLGGPVESVFNEVPGQIVDEALKAGSPSRGIAVGDVRLSLRVSDKQYADTNAVLDAWKKRDRYKLREVDCVTFAGEIASALALQVPDRGSWKTKLPAPFVAELATLNTEDTVLTGVWQYVDDRARVRFRLEIVGKRCTWIDDPPEGSPITHVTTLVGPGLQVDLIRENTAELLPKLGFAGKTAQQIFARKPGPSVLSLRRNGLSELKGQWKGLYITKDNKDDLKEIKFSDKAIVLMRLLK